MGYKKNILFFILMFSAFLICFYCDNLAYKVDFSEKSLTATAETNVVDEQSEYVKEGNISNNDRDIKPSRKAKIYLYIGISVVASLLVIILIGLYVSGKKKRK